MALLLGTVCCLMSSSFAHKLAYCTTFQASVYIMCIRLVCLLATDSWRWASSQHGCRHPRCASDRPGCPRSSPTTRTCQELRWSCCSTKSVQHSRTHRAAVLWPGRSIALQWVMCFGIQKRFFVSSSFQTKAIYLVWLAYVKLVFFLFYWVNSNVESLVMNLKLK